jgi:arsenate reductase (glutaredoxin)
MRTIYIYQNCDSCRKAVKWLKENALEHETKAIRETPPTPDELRAALRSHGGDLRRLFNTSGNDYRELGLKDQLPTMTEDAAIALLASNGNLVKRPFLIADGKFLIGFKADAWEKELL